MDPSDKGLSRERIRQEAQRLRATKGWDPNTTLGKRESAQERWTEMEQSSRHEGVYDDAESCEACKQAQRTNQDETALCEPHLLAAMGLGGFGE